MRKLLEAPLIVDEYKDKDYEMLFLYDMQYQFFALTINWEFQEEATKELLHTYCPDEVTIYKDIEETVLNIPMLDVIYNVLKPNY